MRKLQNRSPKRSDLLVLPPMRKELDKMFLWTIHRCVESQQESRAPLESPAAVVRHVKKNGTPSIVWREGMYYAANLYMENEWMVDDGCMDVLISLKLQFQLKQGIISVHEILQVYLAKRCASRR